MATIEETETDDAAAGEGISGIEKFNQEEVALDIAMEEIESLVLDTINPPENIVAEPLQEVVTAPVSLALNVVPEEKFDKIESLNKSRAKALRKSAKKEQVAAAFEAEEELTIEPTPEIGNDAYIEYLKENLKFPEEARENNIDGTVVIIVVVQEDGSVG